MKHMKQFLAHLCLIFSLLFITLLLVHLFNPKMQLLVGNVMLVYLLLFCAASFGLSFFTLFVKRPPMQKQTNRLLVRHMGSGADHAI